MYANNRDYTKLHCSNKPRCFITYAVAARATLIIAWVSVYSTCLHYLTMQFGKQMLATSCYITIMPVVLLHLPSPKGIYIMLVFIEALKTLM